MTRRVIKPGNDVEGYREVRPTVRRQFQPPTVLNILQSVSPDIARFTIEGEGVEIWCCTQTVFNEQTESPVTARAGGS